MWKGIVLKNSGILNAHQVLMYCICKLSVDIAFVVARKWSMLKETSSRVSKSTLQDEIKHEFESKTGFYYMPGILLE